MLSESIFGTILEIHTKEIEQYIKLENAHKTSFQFKKKKTTSYVRMWFE